MTPKLISLFTGIGGFDSGFGGVVEVPREAVDDAFINLESQVDGFVILRKHDYETVFQNDILNVDKILEWNNMKCSNFNKRSIYDLIRDEDFEFPDCDVIIGGFPCQPFSNAGKRLGFNSDKSHDLKSPANSENNVGNLYKCFVEVVRRKRPKIFVAENVRGLLSIEGAIETICNDFANLGYKVQYQLVDCCEYGIAQTRQRVIIMGIRNDHTENLPENWNVLTKNRRGCKLKHYFNHLENPEVSVAVFPNPASHFLTIESPLSQILCVQVYDNSGRQISEEKNASFYTSLDVSMLPSGLYFMKIKTASGWIERRFQKK